jgi:hypothetical protein
LEGGAVAITSPVPEEEPRKGPSETLILIVFAILTIAASAFVLQRAEHRALHDPAQKGARGEVTGLDSLSFFRAANLRRAIAKVGDGPLPFVTDIRVSAVRVDLTLVNADRSRKRELSYDLDLRPRHQFDFTPSDTPAVRPSEIDPTGPERMIRSVLERTRLPASAVDYVTQDFTNDPATRSWYLFLKEGPARVRQWVAAPDGSDLRHPGEPAIAQRQANARLRSNLARQQRRLKRTLALRTACLRKATDAVAAARCVQRYPL